MRVESSVTSLSWIPSEAVRGLTRLPFEMGMAHYDPPPPDVPEDLDALREADRFRFANDLRAWIEVEDGRVVGWGHSGRGLGERAVLEGGTRTATLRALTPVKVATASAAQIDVEALSEVSRGHRREEK